MKRELLAIFKFGYDYWFGSFKFIFLINAIAKSFINLVINELKTREAHEIIENAYIMLLAVFDYPLCLCPTMAAVILHSIMGVSVAACYVFSLLPKERKSHQYESEPILQVTNLAKNQRKTILGPY